MTTRFQVPQGISVKRLAQTSEDLAAWANIKSLLTPKADHTLKLRNYEATIVWTFTAQKSKCPRRFWR